MPTPAQIHAEHIADKILLLSRAIDGTSSELTAAHGALMEAVEASPTGPGWQWMAMEAFLCAMRKGARDKLPIGGILVGCEEVRDAFILAIDK
jgi:hypothetical protein